MKIIRTLMGIGVIIGMAVACKEEPPPPPKPAPIASNGAATRAAPNTAASAAPARVAAARVSDATVKQYRVEACYYGALGLTKARDAYLKSLGGAAPSKTKLPSFGEFGPSAAGRPRGVLGMAPMPFARYIGACTVAKNRTQPAYATVDPAVATFEPFARKLNRLMMEASRYYQQKTYEKDGMKRGLELHAELTAAFNDLAPQLAELGKAIQPWQDKLPAPSEKLSKSGELAVPAIAEARKLVRLFIADERDTTATKTQYDATAAAIAKLAEYSQKAPTEPHIARVLPQLQQLMKAAAGLLQEKGTLDSDQRYRLTSTMATIVDAHHRAIQAGLRSNLVHKRGAPLHRMNRRIDPGQLRHQLRLPRKAPAPPAQ